MANNDTEASGTLAADGNSDVIRLEHGQFFGSNDFGGGTLQLQARDGHNDAWVSLANGSLTAAGAIGFDFSHPTDVRLNLSGATSPDLDWSISGPG